MLFASHFRVLGVVLLFATACHQEAPTPAVISQAALEGKWLEGAGFYKSVDSKGKVTAQGDVAAANPAIYTTLSSTTWLQSGQLNRTYPYVRQDSLLTRSTYFNNGQDHYDEQFYILRLTDHYLLLRQTRSYADGSKSFDYLTYSR